MMTPLLSVALGGAIGASLRYLSGQALVRLMGTGFPWGSFAVNIVGSFAMGLAFIILSQQAPKLSPFLVVGVLGGFTTFSAFSLEAVTLYDRGQAGLAAVYVIGSVVLSIAALIAGIALARSILS
jgi:fluoride exporter